MIGDDRGPRLDAVGEQHPEQHRRRHTAGDAEEQRGDEVAGLDGVVRALRADDAARVALAEGPLVLGGGDGLPVGEPRAGGRADAGEHAGPDADEGAADDLTPVGQPLADAGAPAAAEGDHVAVDDALLDPRGDLGEAEDAEGDRDEREPVTEEERVEREALLGGRRRHADEAEQEAEEAGGQAFGDVAAGEHGCQRDAEDGEHEQLGARERQHERAGQRHRERQAERADETAGHRGEEGQRQRAFGLPLAGHRVAVEHRHARRGRPGCAEEDGRDGVGGVHDGEGADEQREGLGRIDAERDRQEDRDGARAPEPRDEAHDEAGEDPGEQHDEEGGLGEGLERLERSIEHRRLLQSIETL